MPNQNELDKHLASMTRRVEHLTGKPVVPSIDLEREQKQVSQSVEAILKRAREQARGRER